MTFPFQNRGFVVALLIAITAGPTISPLANAASRARATPDGELDLSIQGAWKFREGACLSGAPPQWEGDVSQYERRMDFNSNHTFIIQELFQGQVSSTATGRFAVRAGDLHLSAIQNCLEGTAPRHCESIPAQSVLLSLQGPELWTLEAQNDAGICAARDVFIGKFVRR